MLTIHPFKSSPFNASICPSGNCTEDPVDCAPSVDFEEEDGTPG